MKNIRLIRLFFDLPNHLNPIFSHCNNFDSITISGFRKPTHLPKNWISFTEYGRPLTSSICMLMPDYPLRINQKGLKAVIQNFQCYYQISSLLGLVN